MTTSQLETNAQQQQFALDVRTGLSHPGQKFLSSQYLYDDVGSALFEAITALPEYGLTRADARLLRSHAASIIECVAEGSTARPLRLIELGSGSGIKTRWLLEAAVERLGRVRYTPIDVSEFALQLCCSALESIAGVAITLQNATYLEGLRSALGDREPGERVLVLFLGSTIGNFPRTDATQFLTQVQGLLESDDAMLLGTDLIKPVRQLMLAYDDPAGVTAAFNRNLLARMNRELCAYFNVREFEHEARFDNRESRVEMHLRSTRAQTVRIDALDRSFDFAAGETIWTESSYKFTPTGVRALAQSAGFECAEQWIDQTWPFAENLLVVP